MVQIPPPNSEDAAIDGLMQAASGHVHLLGVCGIGMAGLACLLRARGLRVSGCDLSRPELAGWLEARGIAVLAGHDPAHLAPDVAWLIRSTAVPDSEPEVQAARARGIPVLRRGEVLAALLGRYTTSIAVSGTHGKTTTTGFIAQLLGHAGRDPAWCIGGDVPILGGVAAPGRGGCLVVEADESDGTAARYRPTVALVTNIEFDHMEHFRDVADFENCFRQFLDGATAGVVYCADDPRARVLGGQAKSPHRLAYGFSADAAVRGSEREEAGGGQSFTLTIHGQPCGRVVLPMAGEHHARNALGAFAVGILLGVGIDELRAAAARFQLARRRFERIAEARGITVISDYAHHPTEIAAVVGTALRLPHRRLVVLYQPHRYTRTRALGPDFPPAFRGVDRLVLAPVYAASEAPLRGGSIWDLYAHFREQGARASGADIPLPHVATSLAEAWGALRRDLRDGDVLLVAGAGDVERVAHWAAAELEPAKPDAAPDALASLAGLELSAASSVRRNETLAPHTSLQVGGPADVWIELASEADLAAVLRWSAAHRIPFSLLGGGYNTLVSDLGVRGICARLTGPAFGVIREEPGLVIAGAAVPLGTLLDWLQARAIGGFEFMEGIPGTLGGGMQMNAGAWGECLGDHLAWIRCLNRDGDVCIVPRDGLDLGYRRCEFLRERVMIEAAFAIRPGDPAAIEARRLEIRQRRAWMAGCRSAGSFFKNPDGAKAGRLLEEVGMHGARVGGACIGTHHANFVITEEGATAADVQALTARGRDAVRERFGIELEAEVKFLG